ncbi:hypothetical protein [Neobacillus ginsengisoli]|uniref:Lipoprotein n=1 Tax=Neobacillus ginsengisoli TaxID=904295 RepID=A0ABT9Y157_9BACI|nr:hypothetical protein [Neobacillus ginsengisoli]MDQ0201373.1 hypothetical protein [Neobacillus ginsengisoli]
MVKKKNKLSVILGLVITIIIISCINLSKDKNVNNPIHLLEVHKLEISMDFKEAIISNQSDEATVKDWDQLLDKIIDIDG